MIKNHPEYIINLLGINCLVSFSIVSVKLLYWILSFIKTYCGSDPVSVYKVHYIIIVFVLVSVVCSIVLIVYHRPLSISLFFSNKTITFSGRKVANVIKQNII